METIGAKTLNFIPSALARLGGLACAIQRKCSSSSLPHPRLEHATVGGQEGLGLRGLCSRKSDKPDAVSWCALSYREGSPESGFSYTPQRKLRPQSTPTQSSTLNFSNFSSVGDWLGRMSSFVIVCVKSQSIFILQGVYLPTIDLQHTTLAAVCVAKPRMCLQPHRFQASDCSQILVV